MVLDDDIYRLTLDAVAAAGARLDAYLESNTWVPGEAIPRVGRNQAGWPEITTNSWDDTTKRPEPKRLFAETTRPGSPLAWTEIAEVNKFVTYVLHRPDITERLTVTAEQVNVAADRSDWLKQLAIHWAVDLPLSLLGRARATGVQHLESLTELYEQRERAWIADSLPIEYFVPLVLTSFATTDTVQLSQSVRIQPIAYTDQLERGRHLVNAAAVPERVVAAATHALVISTPDLPNVGPAGRFAPQHPVRPQHRNRAQCR